MLHRQPVLFKAVNDPPRAISCCLNQSTVDFLRFGCNCKPEDQPCQVIIAQDRSVSVPPVQCQQPALSRLQFVGKICQILVFIHSCLLCRFRISCRKTVFHKPFQAVTDTVLSGFIPVGSGNHPIFHNPAHTGYFLFFCTKHDMACGCTEYDQKIPWLCQADSWQRNMCIHVGNRNSDSLRKPGHRRTSLIQDSCFCTQRINITGEFFINHMLKIRVKGFQKVFRRISIFL